MAISMKKVVVALGAATVLGGCATYHDGYYGYGDRYAYGPNYYYDPYPGYVGPSAGIGFGYSYYDRGDHRHWHHRGDRDHHPRDRVATEGPRTQSELAAQARRDDAMGFRDGRGWSRDGSHSGG